MIIEGRVWKLGDNVDTDQLVPGRYLTLTDSQELASHCLEDTVPRFREEVRPGDILVGGKNFGCGSSREHAPAALKALGISCLLASSFARIFFRNCINLGLPVLIAPEAISDIQDSDRIRVNVETGEIENVSRSFRCSVPPLAPFLLGIIDAGGLTAYARNQLHAQAPETERGVSP